MNMSQAVSKMLKGSGVKFMFGIPGGGSSADLINTSEDEGIPFKPTFCGKVGYISLIFKASVMRLFMICRENGRGPNPPPNLIKPCKDGSFPPICFHLVVSKK